MSARPVPVERRGHPRVVLSVWIQLYGGSRDPVAAELVDLSRGGMLVRAPMLHPIGRVVMLRLSVRGDHPECEALGTVARHAQLAGFGVKFLEANDGFIQFIDDLTTLRPNLRTEFLARILNPRVHLM